jgi:uncharacterized protein
MRWIARLAIAWCVLISATVKIAAADDAADSAAKDQDIRTLLSMSGTANVATQVVQQMIGQYRQMMPQVPDEFWTDFQKQMQPQDLIDLIVPIYSRHFSDDDIKQLIAFYDSPIGKKLVLEQPLIARESFDAGQQWGRKIGAKVMQGLRDKGYLNAPATQPSSDNGSN